MMQFIYTKYTLKQYNNFYKDKLKEFHLFWNSISLIHKIIWTLLTLFFFYQGILGNLTILYYLLENFIHKFIFLQKEGLLLFIILHFILLLLITLVLYKLIINNIFNHNIIPYLILVILSITLDGYFLLIAMSIKLETTSIYAEIIYSNFLIESNDTKYDISSSITESKNSENTSFRRTPKEDNYCDDITQFKLKTITMAMSNSSNGSIKCAGIIAQTFNELIFLKICPKKI